MLPVTLAWRLLNGAVAGDTNSARLGAKVIGPERPILTCERYPSAISVAGVGL